jgi:hypothetical protein
MTRVNRSLRIALASILAVAALGAVVPTAGAYLYWSQPDTLALGRANNDGSGVDNAFVGGLSSTPTQLASDANYLYSGSVNGDVARANLDGTNVDTSFITGFQPIGIAIDAGHVYWGSYNLGYLGRSNLDGTNPNSSFISSSAGIEGVAVDSGHIYWTNYSIPSIFRSNLDGTNVNSSFISGVANLRGLAVDSHHIYWANVGGSIGRANIDGSEVDENFIPLSVNSGVMGVSVDSKYIYWTNLTTGQIGRAKLDGTAVNEDFITTAVSQWGITVNSLPIPSLMPAGKSTKSSLKVRVGCGDSSACSIRLTGKKVGARTATVPKTVQVDAGANPVVKLTCSKALKQALVRGGRVRVTATSQVSGGAKSMVVRVAR